MNNEFLERKQNFEKRSHYELENIPSKLLEDDEEFQNSYRKAKDPFKNIDKSHLFKD